MSLIIAKYSGGTVPIEHIWTASISNNDGIVMTYRNIKTRKIKIYRWVSLGRFLKSRQVNLLDDPNAELIIHIRSSQLDDGQVDTSPCLTKHGYFVYHDGYLYACPEGYKSELEWYVDKLINPLSAEIIYDHEWQVLSSIDVMGTRLALHTPKGIILLNSGYGEFEGRVWYSNDGYKGGIPSIGGSVSCV